jgi:hypothetical protein
MQAPVNDGPDSWTVEEVVQAFDRPLARFFAALTERDRWLFAHGGIDLRGDLRGYSIWEGRIL